jgi:hypothetical protein
LVLPITLSLAIKFWSSILGSQGPLISTHILWFQVSANDQANCKATLFCVCGPEVWTQGLHL